MSTLRELQSLHVSCTAKLVVWAEAKGYQFTWGETLRTAAQAMINAGNGSGITHSLHLIKLAVDLSLFKDGVLLTGVEDYRPLGDYWKTLDPLCCWGGHFLDDHGRSKPDADHFSLTWQGVK